MTTAQLKNQLVKKINTIEDKKRLKFIKEMIELEEQEDEIYVLSDIEKKLLEKSRKDLKEGKFSTHEEVFDRLNKWLKEK